MLMGYSLIVVLTNKNININFNITKALKLMFVVDVVGRLSLV